MNPTDEERAQLDELAEWCLDFFRSDRYSDEGQWGIDAAKVLKRLLAQAERAPTCRLVNGMMVCD